MSGSPQPPPPQFQGANHFSIDVECIASGTQHNAREVAQIALVDQVRSMRRSPHDRVRVVNADP
jgi:hypothetical protein|tara:strand:- start:1654 stop:1845 length:192 start_codon:yes stop_codon:yes gene_type:complete